MLSQEPERLLVLNLFGGVFVAGLGGGGRFKQIKERTTAAGCGGL